MVSHRSSEKSPSPKRGKREKKSQGKGKSTSPRFNIPDILVSEDAEYDGTRVPDATVIRIQETRQCDVHRAVCSDPNDLVRFGTLIMAAGVEWQVCGDCITYLWNGRNPGMAGA